MSSPGSAFQNSSSPIFRNWRKTSLAVGLPGVPVSDLEGIHGLAAAGDAVMLDQLLEERLSDLDLDPTQVRAIVDEKTPSSRQTCMHLAVLEGHEDVLAVLLKHGASLETPDVNARTPFLYCARYGRLGLAKMLYRKGADYEACDKFGDAALALCVAHGYVRMASWLLDELGVDVNAQNIFGETAAHKAARLGDTRIIGLLLEHEIDLRVVGNHGRPRDVAEDPQVRAMLRATGPGGTSANASLNNSSVVPRIFKPLPPTPTRPSEPDLRPMSPIRRELFDSINESEGSSIEFLSWDSDSDSSYDEQEDDHSSESHSRRMSILRARLRRQQTQTDMLSLSLTDMSEVIKTARDEWRRKPSSEELQSTDLMAGAREEDGITIEMSRPGPRIQLETSNMYEPYHEMFEMYAQTSYMSKELRMVVTIKEGDAKNGWHQALVRSTTNGYELISLQILDKKKVTDALDARFPLPDAKKKRKTWWQKCPATIKPLLLQFEAAVGRQRALNIGVLLGRNDQTESEMMTNPVSDFPSFNRFMTETLGASLVELQGFSGYNGMCKRGPAYYMRWREFEVIFFVASLMDADAQRKHIGNAKVLMYYYERNSAKNRIRCAFRGHVNSYGIVVSGLLGASSREKYDVGCFRRMGVEAVHPKLTNLPVPAALLRDTLLAKAVNAQEACYRFLYKSRLSKIWGHEIDKLLTNMETAKPGKRLSMLIKKR